MPEPESLPEMPLTQEPALFSCVAQHSTEGSSHLRLSGELDIASVQHLAVRLSDAFAGARLVILDLRQVTFIDCTGLGAIVAAHDRARRSERRMTLIRGSGQVDRLMELTGLGTRLSFTEPTVSATPQLGRSVAHQD